LEDSDVLTLYSFGPGANSLKPLLTLYEKGIEFKSHFLNPATFEHHSDWFKKINPNGQVPVLDHDGKFITESTVICEYLEDEFSGTPSLRPVDSHGRAQMRLWTKWVDEYFCWCVSTIGWHRMVGGMVRHLGDEEFERMVERVPLKEQQVKWRRARAGFPQEMLNEEMRKIAYCVKKLEARLAMTPWLAGEQYTLADICNFAIANGMQNGFSDLVNEKDTPHLVAWINRINERPACQLMLAKQPSEWANPRRQ
jgi:glutathione S-transferase